MKLINGRIIKQWIGVVVGLLFSFQLMSGQTKPEDKVFEQIDLFEQVDQEIQNDFRIDSDSVIYYLYACNSRTYNSLLNCIQMKDNIKEFNITLLQWLEEDEEEEQELEPWMTQPQTWLNKEVKNNE